MKEVGVKACQSLSTIHNVQGALVDVDDQDDENDHHDEDDDDDHHQDYANNRKDFESNSLKSFIGTVNPETRLDQAKKALEVSSQDKCV